VILAGPNNLITK